MNFDKIETSVEYQQLAEQNKLSVQEEEAISKYLKNLDEKDVSFNADDVKQPDYGPITFWDKRKVVGGTSSLAGTPDGLAGYATMAYHYFTDDIATVMNSEAAINERALSGFFLLPTPFKLLKPLDDVAGAKKAADAGKVGKGIDNPLLPTEGNRGTFKELAKQGTAFDNITPHHMPSAAKMKQAGVKRSDGVSMNMEQPHPGVGGRHRETYTYGLSGNKLEEYLNLSYRDALTHDIVDARRIYMKQDVYTHEIRAGLLNAIRKNRELYPELFNK
ncbi:hypothetical protein QNH47_10040 [Virgibacillus halodenitrificans]|uniref:hypothetical protein n=1 Tax=Virgibacillus halodenitrificans TaxID=1482 RepID=UPI0024C04784|nr:hypothetical protein [Virgibacillus halodenitrificans]WHX24539.1 hypothetical protein QNH47_10040 [Virgibacillus halodenitrificans]